MVRSQRRIRRSSRKAPSRQHIVRTVQRTELGRQLFPSPDPPNWTQMPWFPFTITFSLTADENLTAQKLGIQLTEVLGLPVDATTKNPTYDIRLRIIDVRAWGLAKQPIMLSVHRLNQIGTALRNISDRGSAINYSRVGWHYGVDSTLSLLPNDNDIVFRISGDLTSTNKALVYVRVLWQFANDLEPKLMHPALVKAKPELGLALNLDDMVLYDSM